MIPNVTRRQFLWSTGILTGAAAVVGPRLFLPRPAAAGMVGSVPTEEFCEIIAFTTEPQTRTTSFYIVDMVEGTVTPDGAIFRLPGGPISFADATGLTYRSSMNEIRFAGRFMLVNDEGFDLADPKQIDQGIRLISRLMAKDADLLTIPTMMGAGALLGYRQVVQDSGLDPGGGLPKDDLEAGAAIAQQSLNFLRDEPAAEELKDKDFAKRFAAWKAKVAGTTAATEKTILGAFNACVDAAGNDLALKKCQLKHEAREKCLANAVNQCEGLCKAVAAANDAATTNAADKTCAELFKACTT